MSSLLEYDDTECTDYYQVIGCDPLSSTEQIITEYRLKAISCHPDKNPDSNATQKFALLQVAKEVLTDSERRKDYDMWRNSGINIPYRKWKSMRDSMKMSMHWGYRKHEAMLESSGKVSGNNECLEEDERNVLNSREEMRRKFRNYEI